MPNIAHEKDLTFIIHLRLDNQERESNLTITLSYLNTIFPCSNIIVVEDDAVNKTEKILNTYNNVKHIFFKNLSLYKKSYSYNLGLVNANTKYVCFIDIDCIVDKLNIIKCLEGLDKKQNSVFIGYNGVCLYFKYAVKQHIKNLKSTEIVEYLNGLVDKQKIITGVETEYYNIGNTSAVGGMLLGNRQTFLESGGFNPNFLGWGFEDNEIIARLNKIGVEIYKINTKIPYLFHMPHTHEGEERDKHDFYNINFKEYQKILTMPKSDLLNYIKSWKINENS